MTDNRIIAAALWFVSLGIVASAVLGPLLLDIVRFPISETMEHQLIGGEIASLLLAAPVAAIAGVLWWRGHPLAPALSLGPAAYVAYMYIQYIVGPEYSRYPGNSENAFPLYLGLIVAGWTIAVRSWAALGATRLPDMPRRLRMALGSLLVLANGIFLLAWLASLMEVYTGNPTIEYERDPQLFWLIRLMDLGFVIPIGMATGIALLRSAPWADRAGYALAGFQPLVVAAVAGMAIRMEIKGDPSSDPVLLVAASVLAVAFLVTSTLIFRAVRSAEPRGTSRGAAGMRRDPA